MNRASPKGPSSPGQNGDSLGEQVSQAIESASQETESNAVVTDSLPKAVSSPPAAGGEETSKREFIPKGFYTLSGRTVVWNATLNMIQESPWIGYGFHADRLKLGTHAHNTVLHSLLQSGVLGAVALMGAFVWGWILMVRALWDRNRLPSRHKHLVIQASAVLIFFTLRTIPESTGAFFGVDLLLLAPLLLYLGLVNRWRFSGWTAP